MALGRSGRRAQLCEGMKHYNCLHAGHMYPFNHVFSSPIGAHRRE